jgi:hypothetical protein
MTEFEFLSVLISISLSTDRIPLHGGGQSSHMSWFGKSPVGETYFDD